MEKLSDPGKTAETIKKYDFCFRKKFGQNFLIDARVLEKIIEGAGVCKDDMVLEIGPGIGTLTQYLAEAAGKVVSVEIDRNLLPILEETLAPYDNVKVISSDIMALDLKKLIGTFVDLSANISRRGDNYIVYIKKAQYISDLLGIMGADNAVLEFENIRISKSLHGDVQRMLNCDNANVDRTLSAAEEQRGWIRKIAEDEMGREPLAAELADPGSVFWTDGLRHLPSQLKEVAFIRLYKPEASLAEIGETLNPPIGKPAVSKRFARLKALAEA